MNRENKRRVYNKIKKTTKILSIIVILSMVICNVFAMNVNALTQKNTMELDMVEMPEKTAPAEMVDEADIIEPSDDLDIFMPENNLDITQNIEDFAQTYPCEFILTSYGDDYILQTEPIPQAKNYEMTGFTVDIYNNVKDLEISEEIYEFDLSESIFEDLSRESLNDITERTGNIKDVYEVEKEQGDFILSVNTEYGFCIKYIYEDLIISYNGIICLDTYSEKSDGVFPIVTLTDVIYDKTVALISCSSLSQYEIDDIDSTKETGGIRGGTAYETEPNDTYQTANQIQADYDVYGTIKEPVGSVKDIDWYQVTIANSGIVNFKLTNIPSGCDYDLYVYQSDGTTLVGSSSKGSNADELVSKNVTAGIYYIKVISYSGYNISSYYTVKAEVAPVVEDDYGNDINTAFTINVETTINGIINYAGDLDYFKFTAPCSGTYIIESSGSMDTYGKLFNSSGTLLASNDDGGVGTNFKITYSLTKNSVYYVEVKHYNNTATGSYSIRVTAPDDYGNTFATAFQVTDFSMAYFGTINYNGDLDFIKFVAPVTGEYQMYTMSYQSQNTDTYGYLYNSSQTQLAYNDDGNGNLNFKIVYTLTAGQTYYIKIKHYSTGVGDYLFKIDAPAGGSTVNPSILKNITNGKEFVVLCSLEKITSFNGITFKITYNPAQVTLIDFAAQTVALNIGVGVVADTDLQILTHNTSTGELTFKINKTIPASKMWSGVATIIKFKAKITGNTTISFQQM